MKAYKFLSEGRVGLFSAFTWPPPGEWVEARPPVVDCLTGVHALKVEQLLDWIDDELWEIELAGAITERDEMLVAERGRLTRRVERWDPAAATAFAEACALRATGFAADALRRDGREELAADVEEADDLEAAQRAAAAAAGATGDPGVAEVAAFAADMVALVGGSRPDTWRDDATLTVPTAQTPAAVAANAAFVSAHAAGRAAVAMSASYDAGFAAERAWQLQRFRDVAGI